ncbi:hypothetical protein EDB84DRAFT_1439706 [Lactarius hengduanensis]|nr:hypothetical protein EDB84DRAFT_1439706 [Lactarius hengduanensis]
MRPFPRERGAVPACTPFRANTLACPLLARTGRRGKGGREVPGGVPMCDTLPRKWGKGGAGGGASHAPFPHVRGGAAKGEGMPGAACEWGRVELGVACPRDPRTYGRGQGGKGGGVACLACR